MEDQRLETCVRQNQDIFVVDVSGEVDMGTAPLFKSVVGTAAEQGGHVIINMAGVTYMDSSGFGTLLSATKKLRPTGGSIHLVGCSEIIERMLQITRLNTILGLHASEEEALNAITRNGSAAADFSTAAR